MNSRKITFWRSAGILCALAAGLFFITSAGCKQIITQDEPFEVKVDVNVRVERALEDFFGDLDQRSQTVNVPEPTSP